MDKKVPVPIPAFFYFLAVAILLYGLAGSPTPDQPGLPELLIGLLLLFSIGGAGLLRAVSLSTQGRSAFFSLLQIFFFWGLVCPTLAGAFYGNPTALIVRDLAAFAFLGLPLFLAERIAGDERLVRLLTQCLAVAGICYAVRTLLPVFNIWVPEGELLYLSNSPLTLFAALSALAYCWNGMVRFEKAKTGFIILCAAILILIVTAMLLDVQRATVGAVLLTFLMLAAASVMETPRRVIIPLLIIMLFGVVIYPFIDSIFQAMLVKTSAVGLNARLQEAQAVTDVILADPARLFTGLGWGAVYNSPAVAGLEVNYTHSLLTTMLLKGGGIFFLLAAGVALTAVYEIFLIFQRDRGLAMALFWPVAVPVLLYASHKSLDFGLVLLLTGVWSVRVRALHPREASVKK